MATWQDLVDASLRKLGNTSPDATQRTQGLAEMDRMVGTWNADLGPLFFETLDSTSWTASEASRTIGASGNFNVARPQQVLGAWYRDASDFDHELGVVSFERYQGIPNKTLESTFPEVLAYVATMASSLGTLYIWPVPSATATIRILSRKPLAVGALGDTVTLQPGFEAALVSNLAVGMAPEYGVPIQEIAAVVAAARDGYRAIHHATIQAGVAGIDPLTPGARSGRNPRAYWNI